jgi:Zn-dependent protease with chaperone function
MFFFMVALNFLILAVLIDFLASTALIPPALRGTNWEATWRAVAGAIIFVAPALLIVRQVQRASIRGTAVQLSRTQFPDLYASMDDFARGLGVKPTPTLYLSNGNGTLNAFAAQSGWTNNYVVLSNELFANLRDNNREGTRFILGHETGHIRLHHVALWYQLVLCYSQLIPILGSTLSRLREYSCDRNGAALESKGELGLILLTRRPVRGGSRAAGRAGRAGTPPRRFLGGDRPAASIAPLDRAADLAAARAGPVRPRAQQRPRPPFPERRVNKAGQCQPARGDASNLSGRRMLSRRPGSRTATGAAVRRRIHASAEEQSMALADSSSGYPALNVFWTIIEIFLWVLWFWILIMIFIDIFRSSDLSGWGKALWFLFVLLIPLIGVLVYLIVRGHSMQERSTREAQQQDQAFRQYVQQAAGTTSTADELTKLASLRDQGVITAAEFEAEKSKLLST